MGDKFGGDEFELSVAHGFHGGFIRSEGVLEGHLIIREAEVFAAFGGGVHFLGQLDQLLQDLNRRS